MTSSPNKFFISFCKETNCSFEFDETSGAITTTPAPSRIDYFKIREFYYDEEDEAIAEIAQALRERNKRDYSDHPKPWTEQGFYQEARLVFETAKAYSRITDPEKLRERLEDDLGFYQRKAYTQIAVRNDSPKKRRGRKKKLHLTVINGGYKEEDEVQWRAKDLLVKRDAS